MPVLTASRSESKENKEFGTLPVPKGKGFPRRKNTVTLPVYLLAVPATQVATISLPLPSANGT
jgi:hypothetical protein